jgi:hypothetical protein
MGELSTERGPRVDGLCVAQQYADLCEAQESVQFSICVLHIERNDRSAGEVNSEVSEGPLGRVMGQEAHAVSGLDAGLTQS